MGGSTLAIEAMGISSARPTLQLTGQLGSVMQESAKIALSYLRGSGKKYGIDPDWFNSHQIHLHVPEGATPKDGPSAGVTIATTLLSLATQRRVNKNLAMTGELTLTGAVLPVGGIREKVIAARRANVKVIWLPQANEHDFEELPEHLRKNIKVNFAQRFSDLYQDVFQ